jgi:predicted aspartyl protease
MFNVTVELANLAAPGQTEEVSLLVDTGATLSWIPREILEKLGVVAFSRLPFSFGGWASAGARHYGGVIDH